MQPSILLKGYFSITKGQLQICILSNLVFFFFRIIAGGRYQSFQVWYLHGCKHVYIQRRIINVEHLWWNFLEKSSKSSIIDDLRLGSEYGSEKESCVLKICSKFTGKHPCHSVIVAKQLYWNHTSAWVFSCKFATYFQNTFFQEHLCYFMTSIAAIHFFIVNASNLQEQLQPSRVNFTAAIAIIQFVRREL